MPNYAEAQAAQLDARILELLPRPLKAGTVQSRDTTGTRCMVAFSSSPGNPQPVKCPESIVVDVGDRVGCARFDDDLIIVYNYTLRTLGDAEFHFLWTSTTNITSASFVDMPSSPSASMVKVRDSTLIRLGIDLSCWTSVSGTVVQIGLHVASTDGVTSYDETLFHRAINAATDHREMGGTTTTAALPAGGYVITARWMRVSGTGNLTVDSNDSVSITAREVTS